MTEQQHLQDAAYYKANVRRVRLDRPPPERRSRAGSVPGIAYAWNPGIYNLQNAARERSQRAEKRREFLADEARSQGLSSYYTYSLAVQPPYYGARLQRWSMAIVGSKLFIEDKEYPSIHDALRADRARVYRAGEMDKDGIRGDAEYISPPGAPDVQESAEARYVVEQLLQEAIVNLWTTEEKLRYLPELAKITLSAYKDVGGFKRAQTLEEVTTVLAHEAQKGGVWKLTRRDGKITSFMLYRDQFGRKGIASASDGTRQGVLDWKMLRLDDLRMKRMWAEVSGKPEKYMTKIGYPKVPVETAKDIIQKDIKPEDEFYYTRDIGGKPTRKTVVGFPQIK